MKDENGNWIDGRKKPRWIDISGNRYGRLTVLRMSGYNKHGQTTWHCLCDCGNELKVVDKHALTKKKTNTRSCGCLNLDKIRERNFRHGHATRENQDPLYKVYRGILTRCNNPKATHYEIYGGKGIKCLWKTFMEFEKDMGNEYRKLYKGTRSISIERKDSNGNYCKENCTWASYKVQANNTSRNHNLTYKGETKTLTQWAKEIGSTQERIRARLKLGYTPELALNLPKQKLRRKIMI